MRLARRVAILRELDNLRQVMARLDIPKRGYSGPHVPGKKKNGAN